MFWKRDAITTPVDRESPVFVYQMGKVGSSSVYHSLKGNFPNVVHTHEHQVVANCVRAYAPSERDIYIITGVRDLLRRNISAFFQNIAIAKHPLWYFGPRKAVLAASTEELIAFFNQKHLTHLEDVVAPWFDEFSKATGVNVFEHPFSSEKGFQEIDSRNNIHVFIYRLENIDIAKEELPRFLHSEIIEYNEKNISENKWYNNVYKKFITEYMPSQEILDLVYDGSLMSHFYSVAERNAFKSAWDKKK